MRAQGEVVEVDAHVVDLDPVGGESQLFEATGPEPADGKQKVGRGPQGGVERTVGLADTRGDVVAVDDRRDRQLEAEVIADADELLATGAEVGQAAVEGTGLGDRAHGAETLQATDAVGESAAQPSRDRADPGQAARRGGRTERREDFALASR